MQNPVGPSHAPQSVGNRLGEQVHDQDASDGERALEMTPLGRKHLAGLQPYANGLFMK